ncbi:MAG TPA: hypothetical protein DCZ43_03385, partial [candidate division Zixibacteria bacterium]|nr:hypothetical protein [candidate division Zixibacteria bacterium]
ADSRIISVNISDPTNPILIGNLPGYNNLDLFISGSYAYVATLVGGLRVLDITNVAYPIQVGIYGTALNIVDVFVSGNYAYVSCSDSGISIIDVADVFHPVVTGNRSFWHPYNGEYDPPRRIVVSGSYAYIASCYQGLRIVNISNPRNPIQAGSYSASCAAGIFVRESYVYLTAYDAGLFIINVSDPTHPVLTSRHNVPFSARGIYISGDYAYIADGDLQILNISDPANPSQVGNWNDTNGYTAAVYVSGSYLYLCDGHSIGAGLKIFDISNPANPTFLSVFDDTEGIPTDVVVTDGYAYVTEEWSYSPAQGLQVINVADPFNPTLVENLITPGDGYGIAISEENVFLADSYSLLIFHSNLTGIADGNSNPTSFTISQSYPNPFNAQTTISYSLPKASEVSLDIFDILGSKIETLRTGHQEAGEHQVIWNAGDKPSGIYFYRLKAGEREETNRMVLLK